MSRKNLMSFIFINPRLKASAINILPFQGFLEMLWSKIVTLLSKLETLGSEMMSASGHMTA
jgi:hypothetical protein